MENKLGFFSSLGSHECAQTLVYCTLRYLHMVSKLGEREISPQKLRHQDDFREKILESFAIFLWKINFHISGL